MRFRSSASLAVLILFAAVGPVLGACSDGAAGGPTGAADASPTATTAADGGTKDADSVDPDDTDAATSPDPVVVPGGVRFVGRVDATDPNAVKMAWSGSGVIATVSGAKISVKLTSKESESFYQPVVDGKAGARFQIPNNATQTVVLGDKLTPGDHVVELYRESEGMYGYTVFSGFVDGAVKGAPAPLPRLVEVIGDSISAGYGNLGKEIHPPYDKGCPFTLETQSAYQSYGAILARALKAEVSIVARSGWGMYRDLSGATSGNVPSVYDNAVGTQSGSKWAFARKPDAIVINLGTNDSGPGDPGKPYEDAYVAFLKKLRQKAPNAWIFVTFGPMVAEPKLTTMRTHLTNVLAAAADAKVVKIDIAVQDVSTTGCDYHPSAAEDGRMADALAPAMKQKLGW